MADEKNKDQNQGSERNDRAMGATATSGTQGLQPAQKGQSGQQGQSGQGQSGQQNFGRSQQESAGQGGGIQGQGQRNPSQGQDKGGEYADPDKVNEEIEYANDLFRTNRRWPVFNVTGKTLEETASAHDAVEGGVTGKVLIRVADDVI